MVRSFSKRDRRTHWWNLTSSSSTDLLLPPGKYFIVNIQLTLFCALQKPNGNPNVGNNYIPVLLKTETLKIVQVMGDCLVLSLITMSTLKKHPVEFFKTISVMNCMTSILHKVSYCAKIENLAISSSTNHDNVYVINPVKQLYIRVKSKTSTPSDLQLARRQHCILITCLDGLFKATGTFCGIFSFSLKEPWPSA